MPRCLRPPYPELLPEEYLRYDCPHSPAFEEQVSDPMARLPVDAAVYSSAQSPASSQHRLDDAGSAATSCADSRVCRSRSAVPAHSALPYPGALGTAPYVRPHFSKTVATG